MALDYTQYSDEQNAFLIEKHVFGSTVTEQTGSPKWYMIVTSAGFEFGPATDTFIHRVFSTPGLGRAFDALGALGWLPGMTHDTVAKTITDFYWVNYFTGTTISQIVTENAQTGAPDIIRAGLIAALAVVDAPVPPF